MVRRLGGTDLVLLEQLFERLPDSPFFVKDEDLRYVAANMAMARLCGVARPGDLLGKSAADFFPPMLAQRYETLDRRVLSDGRAISDLLELTTEAGTAPAWLLFSRVPVKSAGGETIGVAGTSRKLKDAERSDPVYRRLADVVARLRERSDGPLQLDDLAALAGVSKSQLERDFRRLFDVSPRSFLQRVRIERACRLLEGEASITAIAYECGYADHSAFSRRFRRITGTSPSRYRALLDRTPAPPSQESR